MPNTYGTKKLYPSPLRSENSYGMDMLDPISSSILRAQYGPNDFGVMNPMYPNTKPPTILTSAPLSQPTFGPVHHYVQDASGTVIKKEIAPAIQGPEDLIKAKQYQQQMEQEGISGMPSAGPGTISLAPGTRKTSGSTMSLAGASPTLSGTPGYSMPSGTTAPGGLETAPQTGISPAMNALSAQFETPEEWQEDYLRWSSFYRNAVRQALGVGDLDPTDPVAQLQEGLMESFEGAPGYDMDYDFNEIINARNQSLIQQANQLEAQLGVEGAYGGVVDEAQRLRGQMATIAEKQYAPQAWQQQQELENQIAQLLQKYATAEAETAQTVRSAGLSAI